MKSPQVTEKHYSISDVEAPVAPAQVFVFISLKKSRQLVMCADNRYVSLVDSCLFVIHHLRYMYIY